MIKFALLCEKGHESEGWFRSSADFDTQAGRGLVECPVCGSAKVAKGLMTPSVQGTDRHAEAATHVLADERATGMREMLRRFRDHVVANTEDVGDKFAEEARKIHYDEVEKRSIRGRATADEARALREEGVDVAPMPVVPDDLA